MDKFKSLVLLDIESTGLPTPRNKIRITEVSLLGVLVSHLIECHKSQKLPRVMQKLNLCFYPQKQIDYEASDITGLDNFLLEDVPPMNKETASMLVSFFRAVPGPICLIAHNGMKFDFQLLKAELSGKSEEIPGVFCADSLEAFRAIFPQAESATLRTSLTPLSPEVSSFQGSPKKFSVKHTLSEDKAGLCSVTTEVTFNLLDTEVTPKTYPPPTSPPSLSRKRKLDEEPSVRKALFPKESTPPISYRLSDLYTSIKGKFPPLCHQAEGDTLALLECIVSCVPDFLTFIGANHLDLSKVPCMW